jgi:hypothetical protein
LFDGFHIFLFLVGILIVVCADWELTIGNNVFKVKQRRPILCVIWSYRRWIIAGRNQQLFLMRADCGMYNIFGLQRVAKTRNKQAAIFNSQLGLTMGDGKVPVDEKDKW